MIALCITRYQAAILRGEEILLIQHREHTDGRSYWVLPGGGIEAGETEIECVRREVREETNLEVRIEALLLDEPPMCDNGGIYQRFKTYLCRPFANEASPGYEPEPEAAAVYSIVEVGWFSLADETTWNDSITNDPITAPLLRRIRTALNGTETGIMDRSIEIRPYREEDLPQVDALEARIQPYLPKDQVEVDAMYLRALHAQQSNDPRWMGFPPYRKRAMEDEYDGFWVAEWQAQNTNSLVGVQAFRAGDVISSRHPLAEAWQERGRVAELRRLRVALEVRGQSLGTRLCQTVIEWSCGR